MRSRGRGGIRASGGREATAVEPTPTSPDGTRPDPDQVRSDALRGVWRWSAGLAGALGLLALLGPRLTGDPLSALLPGVPGAAALALHLAGAAPRRRRAAMVLCTATAGFLALTTVSSLGALRDLGSPRGPAVGFQLACLAAAAAFLARSAPAWRRVEVEGAEADGVLRMYDELRGQYMAQNETRRGRTGRGKDPRSPLRRPPKSGGRG